MPVTVDHLRRYAIARSLFKPTSLGRAIGKLGFVQADPIRAPARAQDLTLRHRVAGYRAGDLERRYPRMPLEEDFFVNYGFLPRAHLGLMHPRTPRTVWTPARREQAMAVLQFIRERGTVHPRAVDAHFAHGKVTNWFGGSSNASTELLDVMHYRGLLRVARREAGTRLYAARAAAALGAAADAGPTAGGAADADPAACGPATMSAPDSGPTEIDPATSAARMDALVDLAVQKYAPLPAGTLAELLRLLRGGVPQWRDQRAAALTRAKQRLASARVEGMQWYWPGTDKPASARWCPDEQVRLLTPFDPVVWDRRRFELFWGWAYRFEAYTPAPKRKLGYYALPLLWHERVIGWGNLAVKEGRLACAFGYIKGRAPRDSAFRAGLEAELARMRAFLGLAG